MRISIFLAASLALPPMCALAQDNAVARSLAATCANCHGTDGRSVTKEVPSLAGLPKQHFVAQMKAFKDGSRQATVMHQLAKGFTDQQIELMADYFSAKK
jgi:cytochrome subunit of sulfide dehydrogenase